MFNWMWVISWSVAAFAVAFILLVVFLVITLVSLRKTLRRTDQLLAHTDEVVLDLEEKIQSLDAYFRIVSDVGDRVDHYYEAHHHESGRETSIAGDIMEIAASGLAVWEKLRKRR